MFNPLSAPSVSIPSPQREQQTVVDPQLLEKARVATINRAKRSCQELIEGSGFYHHSYALAKNLESVWSETVWNELRRMVQSHKYE